MKNKGFTLVEMMATLVIFSIIVGSAIGIFVSVIRIQRYSLATQELLDQASYALEYMSRFLRMARKDDIAIDCLFGAKTNYENPGGDSSKIRFVNYKTPAQCQEFSREWDASAGVYYLAVEFADSGNKFPLTSDKFNLVSLKFNIIGEQQTDTNQPRVTIFMEIEGKSSLFQPQPRLKIQTTISQRNLDVQE